MSELPAAPRGSVYLESRYRKLVRGLPQTVLFCPKCKNHRRRRRHCDLCEGRGRLADDSVQGIVGRVLLPAFGARRGTFHGAGREDVDVRMLGRGRPFVFEIVAPTRPDAAIDTLHLDIASTAAERIEVAPFVPCARDRVAFWKETQFDKVYLAGVQLHGPPAAPPAALLGRRLAVSQRTPTRVAHRRADQWRERWVEVLAVDARDPARVDLTVRCAHGTYVKEWVSGDGGRTRPSCADLLGVAATCTELDVLDIGDGGVPEPLSRRLPR